MGRNYSPEIAVEVAQVARDLRIITNFNVVVGFPGETKETVQSTAEMINKAAPDTFSCFLLFLAPNTFASANPKKYGIEGEGLCWKHDTMTSKEASEAMLGITEEVSSSTSFPGGEYVACYLTSLGYAHKEIRDFYQAVGKLVKGKADEEAISLLGKVIQSFEPFF
jgi:tRNA A37 methylthiotransferase MiaB